MALITLKTSATTRSTRVSRTSSGSTTTKTTSSTTATVTKQAASARAPRALANNEKENINPLTGLDSLQSNKKSKPVFGASSNANTTSKSDLKLKPSAGRAGPVTRSQTSPPPSSQEHAQVPTAQRSTRKSGISKQSRRSNTQLDVVTAEVDILHGAIDALISKRAIKVERDITRADRILAATQHETAADRRARELTVMPLADLSEAFQLPYESTSQSRVEVEALLTQPETKDETRGVKRSLDSLRTAATSPSTSRRASTGDVGAILSRPTKRLRTSAFPPVPPNSPARSRPVALPVTEEDNTSKEETYDETQDQTKGSSHYSSVLDSLSFRAGTSVDSLLLQDTSFGSQL
ncbi:hypothetical protein PIIN_06532 [Serendipita indica DSM 11827]|uniref:Uncharacterized protein n=1 Tax=Serendipita indica (strain DSM 11827) TaxID=1109443 RepID=G4TMQ2_SERID|nr:hypothetical protein PIIN_06532 [Serendipita indica DSM 11827]